MKKFYFTFGQDHRQLDGTIMKDCFVTVEAEDYGAAREIFCREFALPFMGAADRWSFQYEESSANDEFFSYFPGGEYQLIKQQGDES